LPGTWSMKMQISARPRKKSIRRSRDGLSIRLCSGRAIDCSNGDCMFLVPSNAVAVGPANGEHQSACRGNVGAASPRALPSAIFCTDCYKVITRGQPPLGGRPPCARDSSGAWYLSPAARDSEWAAGAKGVAGWRADRVRKLALDDVAWPAGDCEVRHGVQQHARIGVARSMWACTETSSADVGSSDTRNSGFHVGVADRGDRTGAPSASVMSTPTRPTGSAPGAPFRGSRRLRDTRCCTAAWSRGIPSRRGAARSASGRAQSPPIRAPPRAVRCQRGARLPKAVACQW
jgi:hypothetical protein